jgi:translation elongation factor EF-1beta
MNLNKIRKKFTVEMESIGFGISDLEFNITNNNALSIWVRT